jgi:hypothetical protein
MSKTNLGLVEYAKSKLTLPTIYMLSGFGRVLTHANIDKRIANGCAHTIRNQSIIRAGVGKYVFDCVGLIKGYLWETSPGVVPYKMIDGVYFPDSDNNVKGMYDRAIEKGSFVTMPDIPGMLVMTSDLGHVGVYIGKINGLKQYIEATPAFNIWAVGQTNETQRQWAYWAKHYLIEYIEPPKSIYTIVRGDSLSRIAPRFNMTWQELYELNKDVIGDNPSKIEVGMILRLDKNIVFVDRIREVIVEKIVEVEKPLNIILQQDDVTVTVVKEVNK